MTGTDKIITKTYGAQKLLSTSYQNELTKI